MIAGVPTILARIIERKRVELDQRRQRLAQLEARAEEARGARRDFRGAIESRRPAIIAEIKQASPSKGKLTGYFDPAGLAQQYEAGGAAAISVLTDENFFQGSLEDLRNARAAVGLPVLRKDFTIDLFHVVEAAAYGADAILLIAAILTVEQMREFRSAAAYYGMAALVEVHDDDELDAALASGAEIVGVNNRDLHTFEVNLETSLRLASRIPREVLRIGESGIHSATDVQLLASAGFDAFLVGEHLMTSGDPCAALEALRGAGS